MNANKDKVLEKETLVSKESNLKIKAEKDQILIESRKCHICNEKFGDDELDIHLLSCSPIVSQHIDSKCIPCDKSFKDRHYLKETL